MYTSKHYRQLLQSYGMRASKGNVGAYWDNAVVDASLVVSSTSGYLRYTSQHAST